jgi:hypothetical protein
MLGSVKGAAIKLDPLPEDGDRLAIGEGIESTLAGRVFGYAPAWALGSAGAIASFPIIPGVRSLTIFGENDKSGANERACADCKARWQDYARVYRVSPESIMKIIEEEIPIKDRPNGRAESEAEGEEPVVRVILFRPRQKH